MFIELYKVAAALGPRRLSQSTVHRPFDRAWIANVPDTLCCHRLRQLWLGSLVYYREHDEEPQQTRLERVYNSTMTDTLVSGGGGLGIIDGNAGAAKASEGITTRAFALNLAVGFALFVFEVSGFFLLKSSDIGRRL